MGYITVDDLEEALGRPPADVTEEAQWQFWIDTASLWIENNIDWKFSGSVTTTLVRRATTYGELQLPGLPITAIASVKNPDGSDETTAGFDGYDTLFNLYPRQVVTVEYTHGTATVPDDLKAAVTSFLVGYIGVEDGPGDPNLKKYQVGDVIEEYSKGDLPAQLSASELVSETLANYRDEGFTIVASGSNHYYYYGTPAGWPQT